MIEQCYDVADCRYAELERRAREKEAAMGALKEAHACDLQRRKKRASELQTQLDRLALEQQRREKSHENDLQGRDQQIQE